jgi:hypothetical protein
MLRLLIPRSGALVTAAVATRGIAEGARPPPDQKSDSRGKLRDKDVVQDKDPKQNLNQTAQQSPGEMHTKTSNLTGN